MTSRLKFGLSGGLLIASFAVLGAAAAADTVPDYVTRSLDYMGRTRWDQERDPARRPGEIIAFSQIKPGMKVVDLVPGDTYYTRILAHLVGPKGMVYAVVPSGGGGGGRTARQNQRVGKPPSFLPEEEADQCVQGCYEADGTAAVHGINPTTPPAYILPVDLALALENVREFRENVTVLWEDLSSDGGNVALPEQVDAVFSADGYHELHMNADGGTGRRAKAPDVVSIDKSLFEDLKPGGVYVVIDFAGAKDSGFGGADKLHRVEPDAVKQEALSAGFVLDAESKALAKASDDHTSPVGGKFAQQDATDQFVFRFKKPATASGATKRPTPAQEAEIMKNYYGNTHILNADLTALNGDNGNRIRYHYYNADHTYQEMGRVGEGPGPLQEGVWFWDAKGNNCMLHEYPLDERGNTVCHDYVHARPLNVMETQETGARKGTKFMIVPGHVRIP
jgi:predicted methyltransferase